MKQLTALAMSAALVLSGCATSPKSFYANPFKANVVSLCRVVLDQSADRTYRQDVVGELDSRGITGEDCRSKVNTENAVLAGVAVVGLVTAAAITCSNVSCRGGGGGGNYSVRDKDCWGGTGDGPDWQYGPIRVGSYDPYQLDADNDGTGCEASDVIGGA